MKTSDEVHHEAARMLEEHGPDIVNQRSFAEDLTRRVLQRLPGEPPAATRRQAIREWRELVLLYRSLSARNHLLKM